MRVFKMSAVAAAAAVASLVVAMAPAGAAAKARVQRAPNAQSTSFAGYAVGAAGGGPVTSVFAAFTIPSVTCGPTESSGVLPMAEMFDSKGTAFAAGGVFVACDNGGLILRNYISINNYSPATTSFAPAPGDRITVAIKQSTVGAKVIVRDLTQLRGQTFTLLGASFAGSDDTSNIGDSAISLSGTSVPNPAFGSILFSHVWTNGVAIGALPNTGYNQATAPIGSVKISTSPLNTAGTWFRTTQLFAA